MLHIKKTRTYISRAEFFLVFMYAMIDVHISDVPMPKFYPMPILTLEPDAECGADITPIPIPEVIIRQTVTVYVLKSRRIHFNGNIHLSVK